MTKLKLLTPGIQLPPDVLTLDFDTYDITSMYMLKNVCALVFQTAINGCDLEFVQGFEEKLISFIDIVCNKYRPNYFHNVNHAVNVLHMTYILLRDSGMIQSLHPLVLFGTLIAALCHDVDHPGNTNAFERNIGSKLARTYNDNSVLENYHAALTFDLIEYTGLFQNATYDEYGVIRKTIIACILGTDLEKQNMYTFDYQGDEQYRIASDFVHLADLSNVIKRPKISVWWSMQILHEFYNQSIMEQTRGLPASVPMEYDIETIREKEIIFLRTVIIPLWTKFCEKFEHLHYLIDRVDAVYSYWREEISEDSPADDCFAKLSRTSGPWAKSASAGEPCEESLTT